MERPRRGNRKVFSEKEAGKWAVVVEVTVEVI